MSSNCMTLDSLAARDVPIEDDEPYDGQRYDRQLQQHALSIGTRRLGHHPPIG